MFSVLLSIYHKESPSFFRQSLDSIFSQTQLPAEIVLVEDGPLTPELYAVIDEYSSRYNIIKVIKLQNNSGLGIALNEGMKHCSHDLVARMDTDDIAKPYRFEKQLAIFENNPNVDVCSSWIEEFADNTDNIISTRKLPDKHWDIVRFARTRCPINHPAVMFRKSVVQAVGGYKHFLWQEDYYLWIRLIMDGAKFYNIQESLLYFRASPEMFGRRGGWKYLITEMRFHIMIYKLGFISLIRMIINICIRIPIRLCPNRLRELLYTSVLRSN